MLIDDILKRRLIFVTGKGGVGKSSVAASLARLTSGRQIRTALIELDTERSILRFLEPRKKMRKDSLELNPYLTVIQLRTDSILKEFVDEKLHFKGLYKLFFDNRFVSYFIDATPGFHEFLIMSKLWSLVEHSLTPFELVIVDAPATGHALALLDVPKVVTEAVHGGPLRDLAAKTLDLLSDHTKTGVLAVTIPEEMAVTEALTIQKESECFGLETLGCVINQVTTPMDNATDLSRVPSKHQKAISFFSEQNRTWANLERPHIQMIQRSFRKKLLTLSLVHSEDECKIVQSIVGELQNG